MAETNDFRRRRLTLPLSKSYLSSDSDNRADSDSINDDDVSVPIQSRANDEIRKRSSQTVSPSPIKKKKKLTWNNRVLLATEWDDHTSETRSGNNGLSDRFPIAPEIVGTFSCHGMEPAYETDDEDEQEEDDDKACDIPATTTTIVPSIAKINQDRGGIVYPYANHPRTALFSVYDGHGHGGELVSQFAMTEIPKRLAQHEAFPTERAFRDTFRDVDAALSLPDSFHEPLDPEYAGTTACVVIRIDNQLYAANLGDSRAVIARNSDNGMMPVELTYDQNPDVPSEQARIEQCGGYVTPPPAPGLSARVWLDAACTQVGLAMARSLGDHAASTVGVICEPVVSRHEVSPDDEYLIVATDGIWEFISSQQAVDIVKRSMERHQSATMACKALIRVAAQRWREEEGSYRDDITAIVVKLQDLWDYDDGDSSTSEEQE